MPELEIEDLRSWAAAGKAEALAAMTALSGDVSACALARNGQSFPAYKFHEGRMVAMSQLLRLLRGETVDAQSVLAGQVATWEDAVRRAEPKSRDWQAYAAGGLDAVAELARRV